MALIVYPSKSVTVPLNAFAPTLDWRALSPLRQRGLGKIPQAIVGKGASNGENVTYLHRGIAKRAFERRFQLADHVVVTGAELRNGLLRVELVRELPEAKKPRKIEIGAPKKGSKPKLIEGSADAA